MKTVPKVSIIIPVFNSENCLKKCLNSVRNQTLKDIEIILIDDCSNDKSVQIIKETAKKDKRIKYILNKKNGGPATARNLGLKIAIGTYIGFIDSDDYVDLDFYEKLYSAAIEQKADISKTTAIMINPDGITKSVFGPDFTDIQKSKSALSYSFTTCIYNRRFLNKYDIIFPTDLKLAEDAYFILNASLHSNKIALIMSTNYYYVRRTNSLDSSSLNLIKIKQLIKYVSKIIQLINNSPLSEEEYNQTFLWKINYLLTDIFFRTNNKNSQAFITKKAKQLWDLYKYKKQYTAKYISYTNHNNQQGIQLTITHI